MVSTFDRMADVAALHRVSEAYAAFGREHQTFRSITVLRGELEMNVPADVREASNEVARASVAYVSASAIVVPASGLKGAFYRSLISGSQLLSRSKAPQRATKTVDEAFEWICGLERDDGGSGATAAEALQVFRPLVS